MSRLQVGQELWFVPAESRLREPYATTVAKVGRRWATLSNGYRIDLQNACRPFGECSFSVDGAGFSSPGTCWLTRDDYVRHQECARLWCSLTSEIERLWGRFWGRCPTDDPEKLRAALRALGLKEEPSADPTDKAAPARAAGARL